MLKGVPVYLKVIYIELGIFYTPKLYLLGVIDSKVFGSVD